METVISVKNVSKSFGSKIVLKDIGLEVGLGQIYGLIGPSGAGKTTLVKMIVGMDKPDKGDIFVLKTRMPNLDLLARIGYMAQADSLYGELSGKENLEFFGSLFKLGKIKKKERIEYAAKLVNLEKELNKRVANYSGGMRRRLSLAIALISDPEVLILDEPTVGIDPELSYSIWKELKRLKNEEGKTIIVTTHVMDEARKCDYLAMVRDGDIITRGTPDELLQKYEVNNLEEVFLLAGGKKNED